MAYKFNYITLVLSLCMLLTACKEDVVYVIQNPETPEVGEKTPIVLSVGGVDGNQGVATRASGSAVITQNETGMINFPENTNIFMVMESEYDTGHPDFGGSTNKKTTITRGYVAKGTNVVTFDGVNQRYWDDAHARNSQLSIWAYAQMYKTNWTNCTFQKVVDSTKDGWDKFDDAIYFTSSTSNSYDWNQGDVYPGIKYWSVTHNASGVQDGTSILCQDLLFSNNIADNSEYPVAQESKIGDNRLKFNFTSRKFPENPQLYFRHAMSKITIHIKEGDGFIKTGEGANDDFKFTPSTSNVKLMGFNIKGAFNIKEGEFQWLWPEPTSSDAPLDIPNIYKWETPATDDAYTLEALAIPNITPFLKSKNASLSNPYSRFVSGKKNLSTDVMMEFTIDHNTYKITSDALFNALHVGNNPSNNVVSNAKKVTDTNGNYIPLEAGKNYVFTFTVSKSMISGITAQVVDWETVTADNINPSNARISLQLEDRGTAVTTGVDFYRTKDTGNSAISDTYKGYVWSTGYEKGTANFDGNTWKPTNWYWPDNTTFYHFRAVGEKKDASPAAPTVSNDAFTLTAGETYSDYIWGAPFKELDSPTPSANTTKIAYNTTCGFDGNYDGTSNDTHQIYHGIGPTPDPIKLLMFHMMSDVTIKVESVTGDAAVTLAEGDNKTTIKFENIYTSGSVALGNGLVSTSGSAITTGDLTMSSTANQWIYGAIPQNLDGASSTTTDDDVILVITTPDHNQYKVSMKDVKASAVSEANIANPYKKVGGEGADKDKYIIDSWYPGFKYVYTFTLSKKKIEDITATIVNWETVTADDDVQIQ